MIMSKFLQALLPICTLKVARFYRLLIVGGRYLPILLIMLSIVVCISILSTVFISSRIIKGLIEKQVVNITKH